MNYNFIKMKSIGNYLTLIDPTNNPRYMCFSDKSNASHCINYIARFRSEHGYFPNIDLSKSSRQEIKSNVSFKKRSPSEISDMLSIVTLNQDDLDEVCCKNSIGFFYVHNFSYTLKNNEIELLLSAQELNCTPDMYRYTTNLNNIFEK